MFLLLLEKVSIWPIPCENKTMLWEVIRDGGTHRFTRRDRSRMMFEQTRDRYHEIEDGRYSKGSCFNPLRLVAYI